VEILKIRTSPLEVKKTESMNSIQVKIDNNIRMLNYGLERKTKLKLLK